MNKIMNLMISEKIRSYRRERDLTQEQLAQAIGISPQSVSKWECGDGYPDISLLPVIANFFEVTIDELMGNDESSAKEDVKRFWKRYNEVGNDEKLRLALEYYRKYPKEYHIASALAGVIARRDRQKLLPESMPLLREVCGKILKECTDSSLRRTAALYICSVCEKDEVTDWLNEYTHFASQDRADILEECARLKGDEEIFRIRHGANNVFYAVKFLKRNQCAPEHSAEEKVAWYRMQMRLMEIFGDGGVPDGWLGDYVRSSMRCAAALCGCGKQDEGLAELTKTVELERKWRAIPDGTLLELGNPAFFGETRTKKGHDFQLFLPDGKGGEPVQDFFCGYIQTADHNDIYEILTRKTGWEWFDAIRDNPRFVALLKQAKALNESTEEE